MGSNTEAKNQKTEKEQKTNEPTIIFKNSNAPEELKKKIVSIYKKNMGIPTLPGICEAMKKELDEAEPKGWVVFAGMHLVGVCTFIKDTMVEFETNGLAFVIFKTFYPS